MPGCKGCGGDLPPNRGPGRRRMWCSDSCRKRTLYTAPCEDCGGPTGITGTTTPSRRCASCAAARPDLLWEREDIIAAIQAWVDVYGEVPGARDWNPSMAIVQGRPDIAERYVRDASWPASATVQLRFGSWNAAIEAAGFRPMDPGERRDPVSWYENRWGKAAA